MLKGFQYRLYPTKHQTKLLTAQLEECRWLYNHFLAERKEACEKTKTNPKLYDQQNTLPSLKQLRSTLSVVHSQVLQNVAVRVDLAFQAFFRRCKTEENPGYPRFKQFGRYDSMTFPQVPSCCDVRNNYLRVSKIGPVKILLHRPLQGIPKTCTIRRSSAGKWYASFSCQTKQPEPQESSKKEIGIDVGLATFATLSSGEQIENQRFFRTDEKALAKAQRKLSKATKGTLERSKARKPVSRIHERIAFRRNNFAHQTARKIINRFGFIAVEDLEVNRMVHNKCLAKSISDAAWSLFFTLLFFKAAEAGRTIVKVNPAYTSQDCSKCGHRQKMPLSERTYSCPCCRLVIDRDHNAALNILKLGLGQHPVGPIPKRPMRNC